MGYPQLGGRVFDGDQFGGQLTHARDHLGPVLVHAGGEQQQLVHPFRVFLFVAIGFDRVLARIQVQRNELLEISLEAFVLVVFQWAQHLRRIAIWHNNTEWLLRSLTPIGFTCKTFSNLHDSLDTNGRCWRRPAVWRLVIRVVYCFWCCSWTIYCCCWSTMKIEHWLWTLRAGSTRPPLAWPLWASGGREKACSMFHHTGVLSIECVQEHLTFTFLSYFNVRAGC